MKTLVKVAATACLTLWTYVLGGPWLLVTALAFGVIGDGFMSGNPKKWLLPGLLAFFVGHLAYLALFVTTPHTPIDRVTLSIAFVVFLFSGGFILMLWNSLEDMRWPVVAYTIVIAFMGATAAMLDVGTPFVAMGAAMFILSDGLVALETFKIDEDARIRLFTSPVLWVLYFGGQALIAYGFLLSSQLI
jgi:uncharacterized membrane protein YhhN